LGVAGRNVQILIAANELKSMKDANILLKADVSKFNSGDFEKSAEIIPKGVEVAQEHAAELEKYAVNDADWQAYLAQRNSRRRTRVPEPQFVEIYGVHGVRQTEIANEFTSIRRRSRKRSPTCRERDSTRASATICGGRSARYRPDFKFVFAVGSQDAMDHVAAYYLTGREARPDGTTERLTPHEYGALVLEYEHLEDFVPKNDEAAIRPVLREHLYEDKSAEKLAEAKLNPRQRAEATLLMDSNSTTTRAKLAAANLKHAEEMQGLSPHGMLHTMTTPVYLLHGQADNIIPAAETLWMASELPRTALQEVLVSPVLSHLDLDGAKPDVWDQWKLVHFFALVMHAAERK
jgi:pimeloyl-ACP methyl ester carboxylesterase